jgi:dynein heavy chain
MNTVMDDNKMLTLASNERIPLTPTMRLLLEINHMNHCSPATVSRGGVIFVNAEDVGWKPMVDSWIEKLEVGLVFTVLILQPSASLTASCGMEESYSSHQLAAR